MRRRVVRSELPPRFGAPKAPFGDQRADSPYQGEMSRRDKEGRDAVSRRLTERIRTLLFRLYQKWNETDQRIRSLRIRIGTLPSAMPLLHNSSVSLRLTAPFTQRSLWTVQTRYSSKTIGLLLFRPLRGHLPLKGKALRGAHVTAEQNENLQKALPALPGGLSCSLMSFFQTARRIWGSGC